MGTEIKSTLPNYFELYAQSISGANFVGDLLLFSRYGDYVAGRDKVELPLGTKVVVHVPTTSVGFVLWNEQRPVDNRMGLLVEGFVPPKRAELGDLDQAMWEEYEDGRKKDPWQFTNQTVMTGLDDQAIYTFSTSSKTGLNALAKVLKEYGKRIRQGSDDYPVVELQRGSYHDPEYGEVRFPFFKIIDWVNAAPHAALLSGDPVEQPKPVAKTTPKAIAETKTPTEAATKTTAKPAVAKTSPRAKPPVRI